MIAAKKVRLHENKCMVVACAVRETHSIVYIRNFKFCYDPIDDIVYVVTDDKELGTMWRGTCIVVVNDSLSLFRVDSIKSSKILLKNILRF